MSKSEDISNEEVLNKHAGVRLQNLAILHAAYYTFDGFKEAIFHEKDEKIKEIMTQLCFLYGTNLLLKYSSPIIEG